MGTTGTRGDERLRAAWDDHKDRMWRAVLAWAGDPTHKLDLMRSCTLGHFASLADLDGVAFYSLQKGARAARPEDVPPAMQGKPT